MDEVTQLISDYTAQLSVNLRTKHYHTLMQHQAQLAEVGLSLLHTPRAVVERTLQGDRKPLAKFFMYRALYKKFAVVEQQIAQFECATHQSPTITNLRVLLVTQLLCYTRLRITQILSIPDSAIVQEERGVHIFGVYVNDKVSHTASQLLFRLKGKILCVTRPYVHKYLQAFTDGQLSIEILRMYSKHTQRG